MGSPTWLSTISDKAMISRDEVLEWVGVSRAQLSRLIGSHGFPLPRIGPDRGQWRRWGNFDKKLLPSAPLAKRPAHLTSTCRWMVRDVRKWLEQQGEDD